MLSTAQLGFLWMGGDTNKQNNPTGKIEIVCCVLFLYKLYKLHLEYINNKYSIYYLQIPSVKQT